MKAGKIVFLFAIVVVVGLGAYVLQANNAKWTNNPMPSIVPAFTPIPTAKPSPPSLPNPASVYCTQVGGTLTIQKNGIGAEYGLCTFLDNRSCEEWALYHGDCPVGGVKTTGYVTDPERFCGWVGGATTTAPGAKCAFSDGSVCDNDALFNGTCHKGENK
ncbi:MAG: DUF333 domain-containing protein [Patescibacteria group bacterium]|nr:DUF333 domain-containing protein [Patescibacteria group bacterium]MDE2588222.1 DUF333 domain-containing protein [Patescibacteria group bacterium]